MLSSSSSVSRWKAIKVLGKAGCGGPDGSGTRGARRSWRVAIFFARALLRRVRGAMTLQQCVLSVFSVSILSVVNVWCSNGLRRAVTDMVAFD